MSLDHRIQRAPRPNRPLRLLIHSEPKHGKTHLAVGAPRALIFDCEGGADAHGLTRAVELWDPRRSPFGAYARLWIRGAILRCLERW